MSERIATVRVFKYDYIRESSEAWASEACPLCGASSLFVIARARDASTPWISETKWFLCLAPACGRASVSQDGSIAPARAPLPSVIGLDQIEETIWQEVRSALASGANTGAVMLCRKLLFHAAFKVGLSAKNHKGQAPTFRQSVDHLEDVGYITPPLRPLVQHILDIGNEANHELKPIATEAALRVATFTYELLRVTHEHAALAEQLGSPGLEGRTGPESVDSAP